MNAPRQTVYLERASYRRRRARDASRLLPIFFLLIFWIPGLWQTGDEGEIILSSALIFIFVAWWIAIGIAAFLSRYLSAPVVDEASESDTGDAA